MQLSCAPKNAIKSQSALKDEVFKTEKDFENHVKTKGMMEAFYFYADNNAVIKRDDNYLIKGKDEIKKHFSNPKYLKAAVSWTPDFIDVSNDGGMAYTYGKYIWTVKDSLGKTTTSTGIFHTVWKKQKDGSWKYVWD